MFHNRRLYASSARFDGSARALTEDEIRKVAPSLFATAAHASRSDRFAPISTIEVLRALQNEGFAHIGVRQSRSRDGSKRDFTKHLIRLRRLEDGAIRQVGDTVCEILLRNPDDGTAAYDLMTGLFRVLCQNSMVAPRSVVDIVKVRHSGHPLNKVIEGTYRVLGEADKVLAAPQDWSRIPLSSEHAQAFAKATHVLRFGDETRETTTPIETQQLLTVQRPGDQAPDLWRRFNVCQENIIRGGLSARIPAELDARGGAFEAGW